MKREYDAFTNVAGSNQSGVEKHYNRYGHLSHVLDIASNDEVYRVEAVNGRGQVTEARYGNGLQSQYHYEANSGQLVNQQVQDVVGLGAVQDISYQWDSIGNLTNRHNTSSAEGNQKNLLESFQYDELNRLTASTVNGTTKEVRYNSLGNITYKTGVGSYTYGQNGYGPHAVTSTSDGVSYQYDANGNMTSDMAVGQLGGRTLRYTSFDKLNWVQKGNHTVEFKYNPNRSRYLRQDTNSTTGVTTETRYLGTVERIKKSNSSSIEWKRYINGVAVYTVTTSAGGDVQGTEKAYLFKDHLGSTDVITDGVGVVIESLSFDAWGERRNALDWDSLDIASLLDFNSDFLDTTTRGFTGHEMLDSVGIVHMNGRIYDARLGRFLQADSFVDGVTNTQGYNRYSYVHNNPLSVTDPTGHFSLRQVVGIIVAAVGTYICGPNCGQLGFAIIGASAGAAQAAANGGNVLQGAILGGISGAAFSGISGADFSSTFGAFSEVVKFGAFGVVGGITSVISGGKFGHGFIAAGVGGSVGTRVGGVGGSNAWGSVARTVIRTVIGGTISKVTGGKFANGAAYAAFASLIAESADGALKRPNGGDISKLPLSARKALAEGDITSAIESGAINTDKVFKGVGAVDNAAKEVLGAIQPISDKYGLEIGGTIVENGDGYSYTTPYTGKNAAVNVDPTGAVAGYHTHPGGDYMAQFFSNQHNSRGPGDAGWSTTYGKPLYMSHSVGGGITFRICNGGHMTCHVDFNQYRRMSTYGVGGEAVP